MSTTKKTRRWGPSKYYWPARIRDAVRDLRAIIILFSWTRARGGWTVRAVGFSDLTGKGKTRALAMGDLFAQLAAQTPDVPRVMREREAQSRRQQEAMKRARRAAKMRARAKR